MSFALFISCIPRVPLLYLSAPLALNSPCTTGLHRASVCVFVCVCVCAGRPPTFPARIFKAFRAGWLVVCAVCACRPPRLRRARRIYGSGSGVLNYENISIPVSLAVIEGCLWTVSSPSPGLERRIGVVEMKNLSAKVDVQHECGHCCIMWF